MNVAGWADRQLEQFGEIDALVFGDRTWTNSELHDVSCRLATALGEMGLTAGDRVVLWMPNTP